MYKYDDLRIAKGEVQEPPVWCECEGCGAEIREGQEYIQTDDGVLCMECGEDCDDETARVKIAGD